MGQFIVECGPGHFEGLDEEEFERGMAAAGRRADERSAVERELAAVMSGGVGRGGVDLGAGHGLAGEHVDGEGLGGRGGEEGKQLGNAHIGRAADEDDSKQHTEEIAEPEGGKRGHGHGHGDGGGSSGGGGGGGSSGTPRSHLHHTLLAGIDTVVQDGLAPGLGGAGGTHVSVQARTWIQRRMRFMNTAPGQLRLGEVEAMCLEYRALARLVGVLAEGGGLGAELSPVGTEAEVETGAMDGSGESAGNGSHSGGLLW